MTLRVLTAMIAVSVFGMTACQSPNGPLGNSSSKLLQVPVIPNGATFKVKKDIVFTIDNISTHVVSKPYANAAGAQVFDICTLTHEYNSEEAPKTKGHRPSMKAGTDYKFAEVHLDVSYADTPDGSKSMYERSQSSYVLTKTDAKQYGAEIRMYCSVCNKGTPIQLGHYSCTPATPTSIANFFKNQDMPLNIGEGSAVRSIQAEAGVSNIKFDQAPKEIPGEVKL